MNRINSSRQLRQAQSKLSRQRHELEKNIREDWAGVRQNARSLAGDGRMCRKFFAPNKISENKTTRKNAFSLASRFIRKWLAFLA